MMDSNKINSDKIDSFERMADSDKNDGLELSNGFPKMTNSDKNGCLEMPNGIRKMIDSDKNGFQNIVYSDKKLTNGFQKIDSLEIPNGFQKMVYSGNINSLEMPNGFQKMTESDENGGLKLPNGLENLGDSGNVDAVELPKKMEKLLDSGNVDGVELPNLVDCGNVEGVELPNSFMKMIDGCNVDGLELPDGFLKNVHNMLLRADSAASIMSDIDLDEKGLVEELFSLCQINQYDNKARAGIFLQALEKMGIQDDDPRLVPVIKTLNEIKQNSRLPQLHLRQRDVRFLELDKNQFKEVTAGSTVLISNAFKGQFVIPEFSKFCEDISEIYYKCLDNDSGKIANYIPQLARYDPNMWGISLCTIDGQRFSIGDTHQFFTLQSSGNPITYGICLDKMGSDKVHKHLGREPSGRSFKKVELDYNGQPHNPMINSGAIMTSALLLYQIEPSLSMSEKYEYVHNHFQRMCGGLDMSFQNGVFLSERDNADRNYALAYYMREHNCFPRCPEGGNVDIEKVLDFYFQLCSVEMTTSSMSVLAATLANGGVCPTTGERVLKSEAVKHVLSLMYSCGMNTYSGQFAFKVGVPAKSGVSGIVLLVVPNVMGMAMWSPALDNQGNSARGTMAAELLLNKYTFHKRHNVSLNQVNKKDPTANKHCEANISRVIQLLLAASKNDLTAIKRVYLQGFDMNQPSYDGRSALHVAAAEGHIECVKFLVETCGVDLDIQDRWDKTPLDEAIRFKRSAVIALLKKHKNTRSSWFFGEGETEAWTNDDFSLPSVSGTKTEIQIPQELPTLICSGANKPEGKGFE